MYISVTLSALLAITCVFGGTLIGFAITRIYYRQVAIDARQELIDTSRQFQREICKLNDVWCELYDAK